VSKKDEKSIAFYRRLAEERARAMVEKDLVIAERDRAIEKCDLKLADAEIKIGELTASQAAAEIRIDVLATDVQRHMAAGDRHASEAGRVAALIQRSADLEAELATLREGMDVLDTSREALARENRQLKAAAELAKADGADVKSLRRRLHESKGKIDELQAAVTRLEALLKATARHQVEVQLTGSQARAEVVPLPRGPTK
jgi:chromosome segregation ATPase